MENQMNIMIPTVGAMIRGKAFHGQSAGSLMY